MKNNKLLLIEYGEYREEQQKYQTTRHYAEMWNCKEIFNYQPSAFHYRLHNYYTDKNKHNLDIIKVWTGR